MPKFITDIVFPDGYTELTLSQLDAIETSIGEFFSYEGWRNESGDDISFSVEFDADDLWDAKEYLEENAVEHLDSYGRITYNKPTTLEDIT